jgi:hypothetical protein
VRLRDLGRGPLVQPFTTGKHHSFVGGFKFIDTDKYIQIIFVGFEIDEYNFIFIG